MIGVALALAAIAGVAVACAFMASAAAVHWARRARLAEALLDRAASRRSDAATRGNATRAEKQRNRVLETAADLRAALFDKVDTNG